MFLKSDNSTIKIDILLIVLIIILIPFSIFYFYKKSEYEENIKKITYDLEKRVNTIYYTSLEDMSNMYLSRIKDILLDENIKKTIINKNRDDLYNSTYQKYKILKQENKNLSLMQFFDTNNITLLRLQKPQIYDDNVTNTREIISDTNRFFAQKIGFDLSNDGDIYYSFSTPIIYNDINYGVLEIGIDANDILNRLKKILDVDCEVLIDANELNKLNIQKEYSSIGYYNVLFQTELFNILKDDIHLQQKYYKLEKNGKYYIIYTNIFLNNYLNKSLGRIVLASDITHIVFDYKNSLNYSIIVAIFTLIIVLLLLNYSFNYFINKLTYLNQKLTSYQNELEEKVKKRTKKLQLVYKVFENSNESIVITDENVKIIDVNNGFENLTGYTKDEVIAKNPHFLSSGWANESFYKQMWEILEKDGIWSGELKDRKKDGSFYIAEATISALKNESGIITNYIGISRDITEQKNKEDKIKNLAYYDSLTKLPNRTFIYEIILNTLESSKNTNEKHAILFIDLDNFKYINDTLGHFRGDELLISISDRLKDVLPKKNIISRLGGDEFLILCKNIDNNDEIILLIQLITETISKPILIDNNELFTSASIGISLYPDDGEDIDTLIKNADIAMYNVKNFGKNEYQFYNDDMNRITKERLDIESNLRRALENKEFSVYYQPKVDIKTQKVRGVEALIRWESTKLGFVPPNKFIPIAEESGMIVSIGEWVLQKACIDMKKLLDKGINVSVAVNVSSHQLRDRDFFNKLKNALFISKLPSNKLEIEITESALMSDVVKTIELLNQIRDLGIKISIDDFGTGYSSMSYLKKLPIHKLKIDKSFIDDIAVKNEDLSIVSAIIKLAKTLNLTVVAEGVEYKEQVDILKTQECDVIQGYYYSKPLKYEEFENFMNI